MPRRKAQARSKESLAPGTHTDDSKCFHLFPNLPTEIQLQIWIAALPTGMDANGRRILNAICKYTDYEFPCWDGLFRINKRKRGAFVTFPGFFDIGVSAACRASRAIWLKTFKYKLLIDKGVVRYDDETTIRIDNLHFLAPRTSNVHPNPVHRKLILPDWLEKVKRLAVDEKNFYYFIWPHFPTPTVSPIITAFKNLEVLTEIIEVKWSGGGWTNCFVRNRSEIIELNRALAAHKADHDPSCPIPDIQAWKRYLVGGSEVEDMGIGDDD